MFAVPVLAVCLSVPFLIPASAHAGNVHRLQVLASQLGAETVSTQPRLRSLPVESTGANAESLVCLTFNKRETRQTFGLRKAHVYVCFNFLQNPSEGVGNVLDRRGRERCVVTGAFHAGSTAAEDCLVLSLCSKVFVTGACGS